MRVSGLLWEEDRLSCLIEGSSSDLRAIIAGGGGVGRRRQQLIDCLAVLECSACVRTVEIKK